MRLHALALLALALCLAPRIASAGTDPEGDGRARRDRRGASSRRAKLEPLSSRFRAGSPGRETPKTPHSTSVGSPNEGRLEHGAHLNTSKPYFRVVPSSAAGDVRWGLPALTNLLDRAARAVNKRWPGSALDVGDLSRKGGGDVLRHHSHESGRDADVGFYVVDAKGRQVHARTFIKFDADFKSPTVPGARFDEARTWYFVQQVLTDPGAHVSHIFIAEPLRQKLLAYGRTHGASRMVLDRAAFALMQPTQSLPHDDHMHIRISCPSSQRGTCIEIAKNAPRGRSRLARRNARKHRPILRTPPRVDSGGDSAVAIRAKPQKAPAAHGASPAMFRGSAGLSREEADATSTDAMSVLDPRAGSHRE